MSNQTEHGHTSIDECVYTIVRKNRADMRISIDSEGQMIITAPLDSSEIQIQQKIARAVLYYRLTALEYNGRLEMTFPMTDQATE